MFIMYVRIPWGKTRGDGKPAGKRHKYAVFRDSVDLSGEPHEKWTALYSLSDKCRIAGGQNSSKKRTEILL